VKSPQIIQKRRFARTEINNKGIQIQIVHIVSEVRECLLQLNLRSLARQSGLRHRGCSGQGNHSADSLHFVSDHEHRILRIQSALND
jgi:hypothetical protein